MFLVYILLVLVTLVILFYFYFTRTFNYWKDRGVAGPSPIPFFGNLKEGALRKKNYGLVFKELYDAFPDEKVVGIYRMTTPCLLIRDLDIVKHIMIKDFDNFIDRGVEFSKEGFGANLFHADGDTWRVLRNRFTPLFTSGKLKNMLHLLTDCGDNFIKYVDKITAKQSEHEVYKIMQKFTTATISACAFGIDIDIMNPPDLIKSLRKVDELFFTLSFANELDMMYPGILKKLNISILPDFLRTFFLTVVKNVISERKGLPTDRKDFMDLILELRQSREIYGTKRNDDSKQLSLELTEDIIAAQAFLFYVAGYETSATTMAFMLYELAKNPDIQEKLVEHIDQVLEKHGRKITYETLNDMTYLDKVFNETLRLYPLAEPLLRKAQTDYKVPEMNLIIPKGMTVLVSAYGIQHDEKHYSDPEQFDPERHSVENSKDRHTCAFMTFGVGPRNCIGMRFAKVQSQVCMVKFLSNFRVQISRNTPDITPDMCPKRPIIGPKRGILMNVVRR